MIWVVLIPLAAIVFWFWMLLDMARNRNLPPCFLSVTSDKDRLRDWTFVFYLFSIFTAIYYYLNEYRER